MIMPRNVGEDPMRHKRREEYKRLKITLAIVPVISRRVGC